MNLGCLVVQVRGVSVLSACHLIQVCVDVCFGV